MPPAIQESQTTWLVLSNLDSRVAGSIPHHPLFSAAPAIAAIWPAFCGGITFATCAVYLSKSMISVLVDGSTEVTLPPCESETHSTMSGYNSFHAFWNRRCLEKASLASRMISLERGFLVFR